MGGFFSPVVPVRVVPPPPTPPPAPYEITDWETRDRTLAPGTVGVYTPTSAIYVLTEIDDGAGGTIKEWVRPEVAAGLPVLVGKITGDKVPSDETPAWAHLTSGTAAITNEVVGGRQCVQFDIQSSGHAAAKIGGSNDALATFHCGYARVQIDEGDTNARSRVLSVSGHQARTGTDHVQAYSLGNGATHPAAVINFAGGAYGNQYQVVDDGPGRWIWVEMIAPAPRDSNNYIMRVYLDHSPQPVLAVATDYDLIGQGDHLFYLGAFAGIGGIRGQHCISEWIGGNY